MPDRAASISEFRADPVWYIDTLDLGPVTLTRHGTPIAVVLRPEDYDAYRALAREASGIRQAVDTVVARRERGR